MKPEEKPVADLEGRKLRRSKPLIGHTRYSTLKEGLISLSWQEYRDTPDSSTLTAEINLPACAERVIWLWIRHPMFGGCFRLCRLYQVSSDRCFLILKK